MPNPNNPKKPAPKSWNEIEVLISTVAITLTLGIWNLLASGNKQPAVASADANANLQPQPDTPTTVSISPTPPFMLLPGQILLFNSNPTATSVSPIAAVPGVPPSNNNGGGVKPPPPPAPKPPPPPPPPKTGGSHP